MMLLIFVIIGVYLYVSYGYYYAKGMAIYAKYNNTPPSQENRFTHPENCLHSIKNEYRELCKAVTDFQPFESLLELGDVLHATTKYLVIGYLPKSIYCHLLCWSIIFFIAFPTLPATIKLGDRYRKNGCIRNHNNSNNCGHTCDHL